MANYKLLTPPTQNPKLAKGMARGVMTFALHLAPADLSGHEVCPMRTAGCTTGCLNTAGRGAFSGTQAARMRRTRWFFDYRDQFMLALRDDIKKAWDYAAKRGFDAAFRLNATSDIPWHRIPVAGYASIMELFSNLQFYDYTKVAKRLLAETLPRNYHVTFSVAEDNEVEAIRVLEAGGNVAVVFRDRATVERVLAVGIYALQDADGLWPERVIDGDETDLRYLDPKPCIVALYAKGPAKRDTSGFVRDI